MIFFLGQVTPRRQTASDVYEPTVLLHRWAKNYPDLSQAAAVHSILDRDSGELYNNFLQAAGHPATVYPEYNKSYNNTIPGP